MGATARVLYTPEEIAKMEIGNFVNAGLKDVQNNDLYDFDEVSPPMIFYIIIGGCHAVIYYPISLPME